MKNMKEKLFIISALTLILSACSKPTHNASDDIQNTPQIKTAIAGAAATPTIDSEHTAQNSLDWAGVYQGVFPCADCSGIKTRLELKPNHSYELTEQYQDKGNGQEFKSTGTFEFDSSGSLITLDQKAESRKFFIGENFLEARNIETGQKIDGPNAEHYKLSKELH